MADEAWARLLQEPLPQEWAFPLAEYQARLDAVREAMARDGLDVLLIHNVVDMCYLTGYDTVWPSEYVCLVVPLADDPFFHLGDFAVSNVVLNGPVRSFHTLQWSAFQENPALAAEGLAEALAAHGLAGGRIGVQKGRIEIGALGPLDAAAYEQLAASAPHATLVDASLLMFRVRVRKTPAEVEALRRAAAITASGMRRAIEAVRCGATDNEIAANATHALVAAGSEPSSMEPVVSAGYRSGFFHSNVKRYRIHSGDHVLLELGGVYHRYAAPMMRTVVVGPPDRHSRKVADALSSCQETIFEAVRPGRTGHEVAVVAKRRLEGLHEHGELFHSGVFGYSVGVGFPPTWTDGPMYLMSGCHEVLEPGMAFHTPVSLRLLKQWAIGVSECIVVTQDGCEVLGDLSRELVVKQGSREAAGEAIAG